MLRRSFFRPLFWMNMASCGLFAGKHVALKQSKICCFAFLFVFVLISSRGQAQLSVDGTADPTNIIWGHISEISAVASGGTPPYSYGFAPYCSVSQPPTLIPYAIPNSNQYEFCGERTGLWSIVCEASDSSGPPDNVAQDTVSVEVLEPTKFVLLETVFEGPVTIMDGSVSAAALLKFEVRRHTEVVGPCAKACVQTKVWENPPDTEGTTPWSPVNCSSYTVAWGPPTVDLIVDFSVPLSEWNSAEELDVLRSKNIRIRLNYQKCDLGLRILLSNVYRADFRKTMENECQIIISRTGQ